MLDKINPIPQETQDMFTQVSNGINKVIEYFKYFKENIAQLSLDFMSWSYETIVNIVLHTPLFLFDSEWFKDNVVTFSGLAVAMSIVLSVYEGFHRMLGHLFNGKRSNSSNRTDMKRISKRIPLVVAGAALTPLFFLYLFKGINWLTDFIISIGTSQMSENINGLNINDVTWIEMLVFLGFDIALIGMMIPIFLQNFRRWFDLICLACISPLALSCWVFKAHEHHFHTWAENIKKNSLTQLTYAVFLLLIGSLMLTAKTPETSMEVMIKLGICIGGLWRMSNPPAIMRRYVDTGADVTGMWKGAGEHFAKKSPLGKGLSFLKGLKGRKAVGGEA